MLKIYNNIVRNSVLVIASTIHDGTFMMLRHRSALLLMCCVPFHLKMLQLFSQPYRGHGYSADRLESSTANEWINSRLLSHCASVHHIHLLHYRNIYTCLLLLFEGNHIQNVSFDVDCTQIFGTLVLTSIVCKYSER